MKASVLLLLCFVGAAAAAAATTAGVTPRHAVGGKPAADGELATQGTGCSSWNYTYYRNYKCAPSNAVPNDLAPGGKAPRRRAAAVERRPPPAQRLSQHRS